MNSKKLGTALIVVLALSAVMANSAYAAAEEKAATWRTGEAGTVLTGSETVTTTGSGELATTIGSTPLVLKATGLECIECSIKNEEKVVAGKKANTGVGTGKLKFTGVTVSTPSTCAVEGGALETIVVDITPYYMIGVGWITKFEPASGTEFATVKLVKGTGACAISGSYIVSGSLFVEMTNATGVYAVSQGSTSSGSINTAAGGELRFGSKSAELNGTATTVLSGSKKGSVFGAHE